MSLKERVEKFVSGSEFGFYVNSENKKNRIVQYACVDTLEREPSEFQNMSYWEPMNSSPQILTQDDVFVTVRELEDDTVVEEYSFYFSKNGNKTNICWDIKQDKRYGANAYKITLRWPLNCQEDCVAKKHLWLSWNDGEENRQFFFLVPTLGPSRDNRRKDGYRDEYIIELPPDGSVSVSDLTIEGSELFSEKYNLVRGLQ